MTCQLDAPIAFLWRGIYLRDFGTWDPKIAQGGALENQNPQKRKDLGPLPKVATQKVATFVTPKKVATRKVAT